MKGEEIQFSFFQLTSNGDENWEADVSKMAGTQHKYMLQYAYQMTNWITRDPTRVNRMSSSLNLPVPNIDFKLLLWMRTAL